MLSIAVINIVQFIKKKKNQLQMSPKEIHGKSLFLCWLISSVCSFHIFISISFITSLSNIFPFYINFNVCKRSSVCLFLQNVLF